MTWLALAFAGSPEQLMERLRPWLPEAFEESGYAASDPAWLQPLSREVEDAAQLEQAARAGRLLACAWELWDHGPLARTLIQAARRIGVPDPDIFEAHLLLLPGRLVLLCELEEAALAEAVGALPRLPGPLAEAPRLVDSLAELDAQAASVAPAAPKEDVFDLAAVPPVSRLPRACGRALARLVRRRRRCDGYSLFVRSPLADVVAACGRRMRGRSLRALEPAVRVPQGARRQARRALVRSSRDAYRAAAELPETKSQRRFLFVQLRDWTQICEDRACLELEDEELAAGLSADLGTAVLSYRRRDRDGFIEIQAFPDAEPLLVVVAGSILDDSGQSPDELPAQAARRVLRARVGAWLRVHFEDLLCRKALAGVLASAVFAVWGPSLSDETLQRELDLGLATVARLLESGEPARALELLRAVVEREPHLEAQLLDLLEELQWMVEGEEPL